MYRPIKITLIILIIIAFSCGIVTLMKAFHLYFHCHNPLTYLCVSFLSFFISDMINDEILSCEEIKETENENDETF